MLVCTCVYVLFMPIFDFQGHLQFCLLWTEWEQEDLGLNPSPSSAQPWHLGLIIKLSELQGMSAKWSVWRVFTYENPFIVPLV